MKRRFNKKANRPKNPNDELGRILTDLRFGPVLRDQAAQRFKTTPDRRWMFKTFDKLYANKDFRNAVMPQPFPRSLHDIASSLGRYTPGSYLTEIYWACALCSQYATELSQFVELKAEYEISVLLGQHEQTKKLLQYAEHKFGFSLWYIQNSLLHIQDVSGPEQQKRYASRFSSTLGQNSVLAWIIHFISKRSEGNSLKDGLKEETDKFLEEFHNYPAFVSYFRSKITTHPYIQVSEIAGVLCLDGRSSLIDLYESLVIILQTIAADAAVPDEILADILYPTAHLAGKIADPRFQNILRGLGSKTAIAEHEMTANRGQAFDLYTLSNYGEAAVLCNEILRENPNDVAIIRLLANTNCHLATTQEPPKRLIDEIVWHTTKVCETSEDSFYSAYMLMTMASKYYSHSWAPQIRIMVHDMLSPVSKTFPNDAERSLHIHSVQISPFAALAYRGEAQLNFLNTLQQLDWAPATTEIVNAIVKGQTIKLDDSRTRKYLARKMLADGKTQEAKAVFETLYLSAVDRDAVEAALYLARCHIELGEAQQAVEVTVSAFIGQHGVVSRIAFDAIAKLIDEPTSWGESISIPLFYEIYTTYHGPDKATHLRVSFERFEEKNQLTSAISVTDHFEWFSKQRVVYYLDKVCQPDVMRQTLLYNGPAHVESERIKICLLLAEIDPDNSTTYLDEVRQRVKTQQISNGLSIVEQSMVYVDINSITRSLKGRLKDSYSKYKTLADSQRGVERDRGSLFGTIQIANTQFGSIIILPPEIDSSASVFEVMFKEVTNEFLKSDHGLNAFLSTRIRHGKLRNLLRKSVEEENLVTSRKQVTNVYQRNEVWKDRLSHISPPTRDKILDCLDRFSTEFDNKIAYILDVLLRVETEGDASNENGIAWFQYRTSPREIANMKSEGNEDDSLDTFIDRCIELLWQKTDKNLTVARQALTGHLKDEFLKIFDSLSRDLLIPAQRDDIQELLDAIARARNNTQTKLNTAANWFNRSVVYDRPDYSLDMVANVSVVIINNIRSGLLRDFSEHINLNVRSDRDMPGRTLDGLVDLFGILFENAIDHCELDINSLYVDVVLEFSDKVLKLTMVNNVAKSVATPDAQRTLESIKETLGKDGSRKFLQAEGRSGFHKIWKILNSPYYRSPSLKFNYDGSDKFLVDIEVLLEV